MKPAQLIQLEADDLAALRSSISDEGLGQNVAQAKNEIATLVLGLGGGVGIAAVIKSLGLAIEKYFSGRAHLTKARQESIHVRFGKLDLACRSANLPEVLATLQHEAEAAS